MKVHVFVKTVCYFCDVCHIFSKIIYLRQIIFKQTYTHTIPLTGASVVLVVVVVLQVGAFPVQFPVSPSHSRMGLP